MNFSDKTNVGPPHLGKVNIHRLYLKEWITSMSRPQYLGKEKLTTTLKANKMYLSRKWPEMVRWPKMANLPNFFLQKEIID